MTGPVRWLARAVLLLGLVIFSLAGISMSLQPDPVASSGPVSGAVVRVYGANVWGFRGYFAMHTWIATRAAGEATFTRHEVIGWKLRRYGTALQATRGNPDRPWFGSAPVLLYEQSGPAAAALVPRVRQAISAYPYAREYTMWPGPNSNSFTEWVALQVPELGLELPFKAIGKGWMQANYVAAPVEARP